MKKISNNIGIEQLLKQNTAYAKRALETRKQFIRLRLEQEAEIAELFENVASRLAAEIEKGGLDTFTAERYAAIQKQLEEEAKNINDLLTNNFNKNMKSNIKLAVDKNKIITEKMIREAGVTRITPELINKKFNKLQADALAAMWHKTEHNFTIADQIWVKSETAVNNMKTILIDGVATGDDAVKVARKLETYVSGGKSTLAKEYPNMMKRMGGRIPKNISYEALRLARTEMTAAFGNATLKSAAFNPVNKGVKFTLSNSHPEYDICDEIVDADLYGLGKGCYPLDKAPVYPFHPNCLCIMSELSEEPDTVLNILREWEADPSSQPRIEKWYLENYAS